MDDLVAWYRAQLDDDEQTAIAALLGYPGGERPAEPELWHASYHKITQKPASRNDWSPQAMTAVADCGGANVYPAQHIARWDPDRVLREVDAKRKILDEYARLCEFGRLDGDGQRPSDPALHLAWAAFGKVVKLLAAAVDDRPGYRDEWRP